MLCYDLENNTIYYSLSGRDQDILSINANGEVYLLSNENISEQSSYNFDITISDDQQASETKSIMVFVDQYDLEVSYVSEYLDLSNVLTDGTSPNYFASLMMN